MVWSKASAADAGNSCLVMLLTYMQSSNPTALITSHCALYCCSGVLGGQETYNRRAAVGATPGLTRQVSGFQVCADPVTYVLDTPGIMVPNIPSDNVGFRLALAGELHAGYLLGNFVVDMTFQRAGFCMVAAQHAGGLTRCTPL